MNNELKDRVIAFLDILGFERLMKNEEDFNRLLEVIKNLKKHNTNGHVVYRSNDYGSHSRIIMPAVTSFSDSIILSVPAVGEGYFNNITDAVDALLGFIQQLADSLIVGGYILRGGMTRGKLYHEDGVVMGSAYIEAYLLESREAKNPRILLSDELAKEYNESRGTNYYLYEDEISDEKYQYCLNYLKLSFQSPENRTKYIQKAELIALP